MTIYVENDISCNFSGDLKLDQKGDIALATSLDTYRGVANFILRTDLGDYVPNPLVGSNLGAYMGIQNNRDTHEHMEVDILRALTANVFSPAEVSADVLPLSLEAAACFVGIAGSYLISGQLVDVHQSIMAYAFPYMEGEPTPITI